MSVTDRERLGHILEAIDDIVEFVAGGHDEFLKSSKTQKAVFFAFQVIGEASRALSPEVRDLRPDVPWREIIGLRNIVAHEYYALNLDTIWGVIVRDLPALKVAVLELMKTLPSRWEKQTMRIAIASDHAGFPLKQPLIDLARSLGHEVTDFGCYSDAQTDFPRWIRPAAEAVAAGAYDRGIVLGGSGNGEAIVANKVRGIRCGYCFHEESARLTRLHNDANCIAIGQRLVPVELAKKIVEVFLTQAFEGGRHVARLSAIEVP